MNEPTPFDYEPQPEPQANEFDGSDWRNMTIQTHPSAEHGMISCHYNPKRDVIRVDWENMRALHGTQASEHIPGRVGTSGIYEQEEVDFDGSTVDPELAQLWKLALPQRNYLLKQEWETQQGGEPVQTPQTPNIPPVNTNPPNPDWATQQPAPAPMPVLTPEQIAERQLAEETQAHDRAMYESQQRTNPLDVPDANEMLRREIEAGHPYPQEPELMINPNEIIASRVLVETLKETVEHQNTLLEDLIQDEKSLHGKLATQYVETAREKYEKYKRDIELDDSTD